MKSVVLKSKIKNSEFDGKLLDIYGEEKQLEYQKKRYTDAISKFENYYGEGDITIFSAPGRSEIGGNHTDHQHGEVLAASINLDAIGIVKKTDDGVVRVLSDNYPEAVIS